jgi:hypothetical protein
MDLAKQYRVALPWEAPFAHAKQGDFSTPGEFVARSLNRRFIGYIEDKIKSYQRTLSEPYWLVYEQASALLLLLFSCSVPRCMIVSDECVPCA